jgi:hypothetical protein
MRVALVSFSLLAASACSSKKSGPDETPAPPERVRRVGIDASDWRCDVLTTPAVLSQALGAPTREVENTMPAPRGVARPCTYVVEVAPGQEEAWSYDLDCRDGAVKTAEILFTQYRDDSAAQIAAYNEASGGKPVLNDAGVVMPGPGASFDVAVGAKALDHHGQGILFVDDDAPCYVRVVGKDAGRRLVLAKLIAQKLTPATAPMRPRVVGPVTF